MGEEAGSDEARGLGAAMAVVYPDEGGGGRGEDLSLVLERVVRLDHGDRELAHGVGLQVEVPQEPVPDPEPPEAPLQWPNP